MDGREEGKRGGRNEQTNELLCCDSKCVTAWALIQVSLTPKTTPITSKHTASLSLDL